MTSIYFTWYIYIYIFQFYLGFNLLLSLFIIQCVAVYFLTYLFNEKVLARNYLYKKHYVSRCRLNWTIDWQILFLRTIMWHLFYFLILIYFSVLTTVGKSQRQIIMVSQWSTVLYVVLIRILRAALTIFKFIFLWKNFQGVNSCFKSLCLSYLHSWKIC